MTIVTILRFSKLLIVAVLTANGLCGYVSALSAQEATAKTAPLSQEKNSNAATTKEDPLRATVERLLRKLDADALLDRDSAEKELIALGVAAVQYLPPVNARLSTEVATRIFRVRNALDQAAIAARLDGKKFSFQGKHSIVKVLETLGAYSGIQFEIDERFDRQAELKIEELTFWEAVDATLDAAELDVSLYGDKSGLSVVPNGRGIKRRGSVGYNGAYRAEPSLIELSRDLSNNEDGRMRLSVQISWEPAATPIFMTIPGKSVRAKLNNDVELLSLNPLSNPEFTPVEGTLTTEVTLQFAAPPRECDAIKEVSLEVAALVPGSLQTFRFDDLATKETVKLKHGDLTIALEPISQSGEFSEFRMSLLLNDTTGVFDSYRGWVLNKEAYLLDPKGKRLENQGFHTRRLADNEVGISYLFEIPADPQGYVFVYQVPGSVVKRSIPLTIKNIPLP
jgi:hypothetical protein